MFGPTMTATLERNGNRIELELCPPKDEKNAAEAFTTFMNDNRVRAYMLIWYGFTLSSEEIWTRNMASDPKQVAWIIYANGALVGSIGIINIDKDNRHAELGILIADKTYWGKGIASATEAMLAEYCLNNIVAGGLNKLHARVFVENVASRRALENAGFHEIGIRRQDVWKMGRWHDVWLCELLKSDWETIRTERFEAVGLAKVDLYPGCEDCGFPPVV